MQTFVDGCGEPMTEPESGMTTQPSYTVKLTDPLMGEVASSLSDIVDLATDFDLTVYDAQSDSYPYT